MKWVDGLTGGFNRDTKKDEDDERGTRNGEKTMDSPPVKQSETTTAPAEEEKPSTEDKPAAEHSLLQKTSLGGRGLRDLRSFRDYINCINFGFFDFTSVVISFPEVWVACVVEIGGSLLLIMDAWL